MERQGAPELPRDAQQRGLASGRGPWKGSGGIQLKRCSEECGCSLKAQGHRAELDRKLAQVEEAIKIFSRPKVFVKMDA